jgi:hypothetical protein
MAVKVLWFAGYGPNRAHDMLARDSFGKLRDATVFIEHRSYPYWRLIRREYREPHIPGVDTEITTGGPDTEYAKAMQRMKAGK